MRVYQCVISPWMRGVCRFEPTCSDYAVHVMWRHGLLKGGILTLGRLLRCAPWGGVYRDVCGDKALAEEYGVSMQEKQDYIAIEQDRGPAYYRSFPIVLQRGEGVYLWDTDGKRYIDGLSAQSAVNWGHAHPRILKAIEEQVGRMSTVSLVYHHDQMAPALLAMTEYFGYERCAFLNSGAEAVDTAIKIVRRWGYQRRSIKPDHGEVIVMSGNFHGRALSLISASDRPLYRSEFGPYLPGFRTVPFGDIQALEAAITPYTCAVLMEPIQGEAGVIVPPQGYVRQVSEVCKQHDILMIADEIQCGLGRSGVPLYSISQGARPDVVVLGKSLGGGVIPVSAVLTSHNVMSVLDAGSHGSTFGGNPLATRIVQEVVAILKEEGLCEHSMRLGQQWGAYLRSLTLPGVREVRSVGLWVGIEIAPDMPDAVRWTQQKVQHMIDAGLLVKETRGRTIRIAPPLVIQAEHIEHITSIVERVLA